ncbi:MAG: hypothetical protein EBX52_07775 [Proteobacteria bacterium]|nr:hypothetical protein [Pseudomonadota bacterium]
MGRVLFFRGNRMVRRTIQKAIQRAIMKQARRIAVSFFLAGWVWVPAASAYFEYAPNYNVMEEVDRHPYRILPRSHDYAFAIDGDFFKPVFIGGGPQDYYRYDFYHGNGYWLDLRSEFKPREELVVNLKTTFTQGTTSNGPTYLALVIPRLGLTYRSYHFLGLDWETRLGDIDRQTLGTGLFIEMKETAGGYIRATSGDFEARILVDGTGSFSLDGGVNALEVQYQKGLAGVTVMMLETGVDYSPPQITGTVYSRQSWDNGISYSTELGGNSRTYAGLASVTFEQQFDALKVKLKPQFRHYGKFILGNLAGQRGQIMGGVQSGYLEQNYVSYDQNDKPFVLPMNIFFYGDDVETYSGLANVEYRFNSFYRIYAETEAFSFMLHEREPVRALFFRTGFRFFPFKQREDEFGILLGNKYLISSSVDSSGNRIFSVPNEPDFENKPLFLQQFYWMIHYSVKL